MRPSAGCTARSARAWTISAPSPGRGRSCGGACCGVAWLLRSGGDERGGAAVRGQAQQGFMLLSRRAHGVLRLLFAPSVGVTVSLLYALYDMVRIAIRRPHMILWKILIGIVVVGVFVIYQSAIYYAMTQTGSFADASWLVNPDSILPLAGLASMSMDFVKDTHLLSAPIFNLIYLVSEAGFVLFAYGFSKLYGRCQNDDDWS